MLALCITMRRQRFLPKYGRSETVICSVGAVKALIVSRVGSCLDSERGRGFVEYGVI